MGKLSVRARRAIRIADAMPFAATLTEHDRKVNSSPLTMRVDYRSDEVHPMWLATPFTVNGRGDEPLAESNYRVVRADLERRSAFGTNYRIDAWAGGTVHTLQVRADDALALHAVQRWVEALADYPVADEEDLAELEAADGKEWQ